MKKFKMPSLLKGLKKTQISRAKDKTKAYILKAKEKINNLKAKAVKAPKAALLIVLLASAIIGGTAYYTGIIDTFIKNPSPYIEVNQDQEPEVKTVPSAIPEAPDVVGTPSFPNKQAQEPENTGIDEQAKVEDSPKQVETIKINFISPAEGKVVREFGFNYSKIYNDYRFHDGIDLEVPQGAPVKAAADGKVVKVSYTELEKYSIILDHGAYLQTIYKHLSEVDVKKGDAVKQGQQMGKVKDLESHLHFGIGYKGDKEDPAKYLEEFRLENE